MIGQQANKLDLQKNVNAFGYVDKFYGYGQSLLIKTKVYPLSKEHQPLLGVLNDFRKTYYKFELQKVIEKDQMMLTLANGGKLAHKDLVPDINVAATLRMSLAIQEAIDQNKAGQEVESIDTDEQSLALILNVDLYSTIRLYQV
jgi:hypothetical protein